MKNLILIVLATAFFACSSGTEKAEETSNVIQNPPAEGFNLEASDEKAMLIADEVMVAMGGREAWDNTAVIAWNFMGRRDLVWNKKTGDVRIDSPNDTTVYLLNIQTMEGKVFKNGEELTEQETLRTMLERGRSIWINDSYWLCMPFKLKDSGVTLTYVREDTTRAGEMSDVLQLTFNEVGVTPDNKYEVWVDRNDHLVKQWAYFREASQDSASAIWPFDNYRQYGDILLSAERSDTRGPANVRVFDSVDASVFNDPAAPQFPAN